MALKQLELWAPSRTPSTRASRRHRRYPSAAPIGSVASAPAKLVELEPLRQLDVRAQYYLDNARAARTRSAYERDVTAFARWCTEQGLSSMPASYHTLARYLTHLVESGRKVSTVKRGRIAIGLAHADLGLARPDHDSRIRTLERGMGRTYGTRQVGAAPLLLEHIQKIVHGLGTCARDDRDRALLLVGFWGALRASELVALTVDDITLTPQQLLVHVQRSKEDPLGLGTVVALASISNELCALRATERWLERVGRAPGPLFRSVQGERIAECSMHPRAISRAIHRLAVRASISGEYTSHSLRAGLATSAYARGVTEREIQEHGRWKDRRSLDRYIHLSALTDRRNLVSATLVSLPQHSQRPTANPGAGRTS